MTNQEFEIEKGIIDVDEFIPFFCLVPEQL